MMHFCSALSALLCCLISCFILTSYCPDSGKCQEFHSASRVHCFLGIVSPIYKCVMACGLLRCSSGKTVRCSGVFSRGRLEMVS